MIKEDRLEKRNRLIVYKFYELHDIKRTRIDDVLIALEEEYFFLDQAYIYSLIFYNKTYNDMYSKLVKEKPKALSISVNDIYSNRIKK